jgi:hypothetical protein
MNTWSEFIYAGHGYRLSGGASLDSPFSLTDEDGQELLHSSGDQSLQINLLRPLPLPLLNITILRLLEERGGAAAPATAPA